MNSANRQRLELEARLNKISSAAVREPVVDDRTGYRAIETSVEGVESKNMKDLQVRAQLAKISTNAIVDKLGVRPAKPKSEVTKEMILEYQKEMLKPVEIGGVKYRYHPSSLDLDELAYAPIHKIFPPAAIDGMKRGAAYIAGTTIPDLELELDYLAGTELPQIREVYDAEVSKIQLAGHISKANKAKAIQRLTTQFDAETRENNAKQLMVIEQIRDGEAKIASLRDQIDKNEDHIKENRAEEVRIQKENERRLRAYEEDLNLLNRGKLNVRQEPNESDEDYRERLRETGQMTVSEESMRDSSELYFRDILREKCLELVRDTGIISNALKFLTSDQVYQLVKYWPRIKREFLKVYGFDNKTIREADLIDFFESSIDPIVDAANKGKEPVAPEREPEPEEATAVVPTAEARAPEIPLAEFRRMTRLEMQAWIAQNHNSFFSEFGKLKNKEERTKFVVDKGWTDQPAPAPAPETSIAVPSRSIASPALASSLARRIFSIEELAEYSRPLLEKVRAREDRIATTSADADTVRTSEEMVRTIDLAGRALGRDDRDGFYTALERLESIEPGLIITGLPEIYPRLAGSGLKPITQDLPMLIEFGKVKISPKRLYYNNVLAIKHKSGKSLGGLPNVQVSEKFVSIIMNLLRGQKPTLKDFSQLDINEKGIYDSLIQIAGLHKDIDNTFGESKQHLKKRLELVEGEIGAGNNNPALKKELHGLLGKMAHSGMIGYGDARKHYLSVTRG